MILNKYRYLFVDGSYYLKKNSFISWNNWIKSGKTSSFTHLDISRMMMYSINKVMKEMNGADKVFILWDAWSAEVNGYYTTSILKGNYKDGRVYVTEKDADNPDLSEEEKQKVLDEAYKNKIQKEAKSFMIDNLKNLGIPSIRYWGYEADSLAFIYSSILASSDKRSAFASADGDWGYNVTNPNCDYYKIGVRGAPSKLVTYNDMIKEIPSDLLGKVSLYDWKAYYDSLEGSHNDMRKTRRDKFDTKFIIQNLVEREDYTGIENIDLFRLQYSTFKIERFPNFNKIIDEFNSKILEGSIFNIEEFRDFMSSNNLGISESWYTRFSDSLDHNLYGDR